MKIKEVIKVIEKWAPRGAAWEKDNVGLQIGDVNNNVNKILLALDVTEKLIDYAIANGFNFIFTHHPFFFFPLKKISFGDNSKSNIIRKIIEHNITIYSAHTNLDFTKDGVSFQIAKKLGLTKIGFLHNLSEKQYKLVVFVPENNVKKVADAIFNAGGGVIGEYEKCSFEINGIGTFQGNENSNPALGEKLHYERVNEIRLEVLIDSWKLNDVIKAIKNSHPYEEPAFDIYLLKNSSVNYGEGAIGELKNPLKINDFLNLVSSKLKIPTLRYSKGKSARIKKVAVCGGTCASLLNEAIKSGADAFITADVKYHEFQEAEGKIYFIDAGHYETEITVLPEVKKRLSDFMKQTNENFEVKIFGKNTNPVKYYLNIKEN